MVVRETAGALRGLGLDPAGLVVACRRILERHPTAGALWWLCAHVLASPDPLRTAWALADELDDDPTADVLVAALPEDATVVVVGWPDLAGEALLRRGDLQVLAVDANDDGSSFVRRLQRSDVEASIVPPAGLAAAVLASDLVLIEANATGPSELLAAQCSRAAASVGYCSEVPVWMVVGRGRRLPAAMFDTVLERAAAEARGGNAWHAPYEPVPAALGTTFVLPDGVLSADEAVLSAECPLAPELLRSSAM